MANLEYHNNVSESSSSSFSLILQDFFSCFRFIFYSWKQTVSAFPVWRKSLSCLIKNAETWCIKNSNNNAASTSPPAEAPTMTLEEVRAAMEELSRAWGGIDDVLLFAEGEEPSLEEVKEAFALFDENRDGFIDASELGNVLSGLLSFGEFASEAECRRMICVFDDDEDGRIDFHEFVKVLETSFSFSS